MQPLVLNANKTFTLSHVYADSGGYTVQVSVSGVVGTGSVVVQVNNVAPKVAIQPHQLDTGNYYISTNNILYEYTPDSAQVFAVPIPYPGTDYYQEARDIVPAHDGRIYVYNGTYSAYLSAYDPRTGSWSQQTFPGWNTANNLSYGGIAALNNYVYASDMQTGNDSQSQSGIVRFDLASGSATRFASDKQFIQLNIGYDGLLYGLEGELGVDVYDPGTMQFLRHIALPYYDYRGIAIDASGTIFAAGWDGNVYCFDSSGILLRSLATGYGSLTDIDLSPGGQLLVGSRLNGAFVTDESLQAIQPRITTSGSPFFVSWATYLVDPSSTPPQVNAGDTFTDTGSFIDPGADTWTATVDYGDGSGVQPLALNADKTFSLSHVYGVSGTYSITVTVNDGDGGVGTDVLPVQVNSIAAPAASAGPNTSSNMMAQAAPPTQSSARPAGAEPTRRPSGQHSGHGNSAHDDALRLAHPSHRRRGGLTHHDTSNDITRRHR